MSAGLQGRIAMLSPVIVIDREIVEHSFREWQEEQTLLDAQLAESVAALDAYQAHLDKWQQELVREREELRHLRESIGRDQADAGVAHEQIEHLNHDLEKSREKISSLTTALLARTEELRDLDRRREIASAELALVRVREKELEAALAARPVTGQAQRHDEEIPTNHPTDALVGAARPAAAGSPGESAKSGPAKVEPRRTVSPVLGSVMEQFGKLREQRSLNRSNNKPR